jgi:hypothetical protein
LNDEISPFKYPGLRQQLLLTVFGGKSILSNPHTLHWCPWYRNTKIGNENKTQFVHVYILPGFVSLTAEDCGVPVAKVLLKLRKSMLNITI